VINSTTYAIEGFVLESLVPNAKATEWTIRVRDGIHFRDGSQIGAEDLIYTLRAYGGKTSTTPLASSFIDMPRMRKLDQNTALVPLKSANSEFPYFLQLMYLFKAGTTDFKQPNGTGPFNKLVSYSPGVQATMARNPHYWQPGKPYLDEFRVVDIQDEAARMNALLGGQVQGIENVSFAQAKQYDKSSALKPLIVKGTNYVPIYMATTLAPFQDVRVRQAMRLIANRPQLVQEANLGFGEVANDLYGAGHPFYDSSLPQRQQDIAQAKSLLKAAGKSDLRVTLYTSTAQPGMLESATVFAAQAKQAGVTIQLQTIPAGDYFGADYLKQNFAQSEWSGYDSVLSQMARSVAPNAPFNETHWNDAHWSALYYQALATTETRKKTELVNELQKILWDQGGYIYWGTFDSITGLNPKVMGAVPNPGTPNFYDYWLA
jgi:peptide/nickel transport system substrate-binding protein